MRRSAHTQTRPMTIPLARYWALLARYLRDQRSRFVVLTVLLLLSVAFSLLIPQVTRIFIDDANASAPLNQLLLTAAAFMALAIAGQALSVIATYVGETLAWNATNALRVDIARHCLHLDMAFHKAKTPGEMIERLDEDINAMARFFSQLVVMMGGNLLLMAGVLALLAVENRWLGLAFTLFSLASLLVLNRLRELAVAYEVDQRQANAEIFGFLEERLSGTEDVRSSGAVDYVINGLYRLHSNLFTAWERVQLRYWLLGVVGGVITVCGYGLALGGGFYFYNAGVIGMGTAFMIVHYMNLLARPLQQLSAQVQGLQAVGASIERIAQLTDEQPRVADGHGTPLPSGPLSLTFERVTFAYEDGEPVLDDVSFQVPAGHVLGLLGRTGSGKTTLARLVFRLYDPGAGMIRIGGVPVDAPRLAELRQRVAMVTQDVQLFQASIRDNLTFFQADVSDQRIVDVLEQVELGYWLARQPHGLDTRLETGGRSMSAGEAQLLAFARVFLRDPGLVVLDEASSRLDPATELRIERAMDRLLAGRTAVIIAHRLGTVQRADHILVLEHGRVAELGRRAALAADPGSRFARLLATAREQAAGSLA
jgi:ATP-binding cassette, subfamily B, bacterial